MKAGFDFTAFTLAIASRKVPSASGLAGLLKPMWVSLICRKVKPDASAANASPSSPTDFGTPPDNAHRTPVPAQIMHSRAPRRSTSRPSDPRFFVLSMLCLLHPGNCCYMKETAVRAILFPARANFFRSSWSRLLVEGARPFSRQPQDLRVSRLELWALRQAASPCPLLSRDCPPLLSPDALARSASRSCRRSYSGS